MPVQDKTLEILHTFPESPQSLSSITSPNLRSQSLNGNPQLARFMDEYLYRDFSTYPTYDQFKIALPKTDQDHALSDYIAEKFEFRRGEGRTYVGLFAQAQTKGAAGKALYVHEFAEQWLNVTKYGLSLEQIRDDQTRMRVYPSAHTDAIQAQYLYLQREAFKLNKVLSLASLILADPLNCDLRYVYPPADMHYWNCGNYLFALLGEFSDELAPSLNEMNQAMEFYLESSLVVDRNSSDALRYKASVLTVYATFMGNIVPLAEELRGKISTVDIHDGYALGYDVARMLGVEQFKGHVARQELEGLSYRVRQALVEPAASTFIQAIETKRDYIVGRPALRYEEALSILTSGQIDRLIDFFSLFIRD